MLAERNYMGVCEGGEKDDGRDTGIEEGRICAGKASSGDWLGLGMGLAEKKTNKNCTARKEV